MSDWMVIAGLEIHADLMMKSIKFSGCPVVDNALCYCSRTGIRLAAQA